MPINETSEERLDEWLRLIDHLGRRSRIVERTLRGQRIGPLTIPVRFGLKVAELGPIGATRLAFSVVANRYGRR